MRVSESVCEGDLDPDLLCDAVALELGVTLWLCVAELDWVWDKVTEFVCVCEGDEDPLKDCVVVSEGVRDCERDCDWLEEEVMLGLQAT